MSVLYWCIVLYCIGLSLIEHRSGNENLCVRTRLLKFPSISFSLPAPFTRSILFVYSFLRSDLMRNNLHAHPHMIIYV